MGEDDAAAEQTQRGQSGREAETDEGAARPGELGGADVLAALIGGGELGDVSPSGGHRGAHGQADDDEPGEQHRQIHGEDDDQAAQDVEEQIVGVDEFAAVLVA